MMSRGRLLFRVKSLGDPWTCLNVPCTAAAASAHTMMRATRMRRSVMRCKSLCAAAVLIELGATLSIRALHQAIMVFVLTC